MQNPAEAATTYPLGGAVAGKESPAAQGQTERIDRASRTVRALAAVSGMTFAQATTIATAAGRKRGTRFKSVLVIEQAKAMDLTLRKLRFTKKTLGKFINNHPIGRFYLHKRGHAFAVINGQCSDKTTMGSIVIAAWQFIE